MSRNIWSAAAGMTVSGPSPTFTGGRAAGVARADIFIVGEDAGDCTIQVNALDPVLFGDFVHAGAGDRLLAEVCEDVAAVVAGVERGEDGFAVGALPDAHVERNANRGLLGRIGAADLGRGLPA
jgi:hypothetical protein